ncbi:hypothetical protein [Cryptosporangium sp. NPDC051539]|uniref:hypothetical protein n=1 Tax=Cryptosporangium sp. NPDC051539 TaxID=3363962 RepID=UPI0037881E15
MRPRTAQTVDRLVLLVATVGLAARQYGAPSRAFWDDIPIDQGYVVITLTLTIGLFGALTPFHTVSLRRQAKRKDLLRQQILSHFGRLIAIALRSNAGIDPGDLGLHVWRVGRMIRPPWRPRLIRLATYRLGSTPATRTFKPTRGMGVVGLSWKRNEETSVDVTALSARLTNSKAFADYRAQQGDDAVMGLSWEDFNRVKHRGAVFASPIRDGGGEFVGCVSVDASHGYSSLDTPELWHEINALCAEIGDENLPYL